MLSQPISTSFDMGGGRVVTIETGKLARQADGAVTVRQGNCVLLATVVAATTVGIAQFSNNAKTTKANELKIERVNGITGLNFQDTTKPQKDSLPPKPDSTKRN